jgi:hypothetical protein
MDIQKSAFTIKLKLCFCTILGIRIDDCCVLYTLPAVCLEQVAKDIFLVKLSILICNFGQ